MGIWFPPRLEGCAMKYAIVFLFDCMLVLGHLYQLCMVTNCD